MDALRDVSCRVPERGVAGLIGGNGAGKTTLLDSLAGFVGPDEGKIYETGSNEALSPNRRRQLCSVLPQSLTVPPSVPARNFLEVAAEPKRAGSVFSPNKDASDEASIPSEAESEVWAEARGMFGREGIAIDRPFEELSWGQQRVVALAASLVAPKRVVLLDEPFTGLSGSLLEMARRLCDIASRRRPLVVAEHDLDLVIEMADAIWVLRDGAFEGVLKPDDIGKDDLLDFFL